MAQRMENAASHLLDYAMEQLETKGAFRPEVLVYGSEYEDELYDKGEVFSFDFPQDSDAETAVRNALSSLVQKLKAEFICTAFTTVAYRLNGGVQSPAVPEQTECLIVLVETANHNLGYIGQNFERINDLIVPTATNHAEYDYLEAIKPFWGIFPRPGHLRCKRCGGSRLMPIF